MMLNISPNTQAILLLTAPLIVGKNEASAKLLSHSEYSRLARHLHEMQKQPSDLVTTQSLDLIRTCQGVVPENRLQELLARGFLLSQALERWQARSIWVLSRADPQYPQRLKTRLRSDSPALLYGCGPVELLDKGDLAVVGSRHVDEGLIQCTKAIGNLAARAGKTLVSGGAKGIDQAATNGALEAGGRAIGVLADSLEKSALKHEHRSFLRDGRLVLISPYDPNAGFNVGHAMQRNKLIYGLAKIALVMNSDLNKGGTWAGATEQLDRFRFGPVYVRTKGEASVGLKALLERGAQPWPNPQDLDAFEAAFQLHKDTPAEMTQADLALALTSEPSVAVEADQQLLLKPSSAPEMNAKTTIALAIYSNDSISSMSKEAAPAETLFVAVREVVQKLLEEPLKEADIASQLQVSTAQVKLWLKRLLEEGIIAKQKKPMGYIAKQSRLFR